MEFNKVEVLREGASTYIKINGQEIKAVRDYQIGQERGESTMYLTIKMAIDEKNSSITIKD